MIVEAAPVVSGPRPADRNIAANAKEHNEFEQSAGHGGLSAFEIDSIVRRDVVRQDVVRQQGAAPNHRKPIGAVLMADDTTASVNSLHQPRPKRAKTPADRAKTYRQRKKSRPAAKAAPSSSDHLIPLDPLPADARLRCRQTNCVSRRNSRVQHRPRPSRYAPLRPSLEERRLLAPSQALRNRSGPMYLCKGHGQRYPHHADRHLIPVEVRPHVSAAMGHFQTFVEGP
jgi:hypothetical protein